MCERGSSKRIVQCAAPDAATLSRKALTMRTRFDNKIDFDPSTADLIAMSWDHDFEMLGCMTMDCLYHSPDGRYYLQHVEDETGDEYPVGSTVPLEAEEAEMTARQWELKAATCGGTPPPFPEPWRRR